MAYVRPVDKIGQVKNVEGYCYYDGISIWSEHDAWYFQDVWRYLLDRLVFECTAWKEVMTVGGYLPHPTWKKVSHVDVPTPDPEQNFVVEEPFDEATRDGGEDCRYSVRYSGKQRLVNVCVDTESGGHEVFVSPHRNLILGAHRRKEGLLLGSIYFLDVRGCPE